MILLIQDEYKSIFTYVRILDGGGNNFMLYIKQQYANSLPCLRVYNSFHYQKYIINAVGSLRNNIPSGNIADDLHFTWRCRCFFIPDFLDKRVSGDSGHPGSHIHIMLRSKKDARNFIMSFRHCLKAVFQRCFILFPAVILSGWDLIQMHWLNNLDKHIRSLFNTAYVDIRCMLDLTYQQRRMLGHIALRLSG